MGIAEVGAQGSDLGSISFHRHASKSAAVNVALTSLYTAISHCCFTVSLSLYKDKNSILIRPLYVTLKGESYVHDELGL